MKKFTSLSEALAHKPTCPCCHENLSFDADVVSKTNSSGFDDITITFNFENTLLEVDYVTGHVKKYCETRSLEKVYRTDHEKPAYIYGNFQPFANIFGATVSCHSCRDYRYLLQIHTSKEKITDIYLNVEYLSLKDSSGTLHEIKNNFFVKTTEYTYFRPYPKGSKSSGFEINNTITLPLIELSASDPQKTLNKIKTLIIFS